ncbi:hypothetical protein CERSUDRAFT_145210 [Gelatoporia subvermispora B]|uniref:Uncharacterized protein n=1 Tax=Ceriporiopsis subvermispora (strain B) TaxID=914234 RepID=M2QZB0_CERS8|nr:hypothetical protein CERSUDRAFT_145210 [Gelatoporia subvermispora B]
MLAIYLASLAASLPLAAGHAAIFHPSMWGFNVTQQTFPYDNRPVAPLMNMTFDQWWFHGHLDYPPHPTDFFELPAGQPATAEVACTKSATTWFNSSGGGDIQSGNDPCPGSPPSEYHTTGISDVKGCALAIAYKSNVTDVQPEDFSVFSVNQTCVWNRFTDFQVPERMPACPPGGCICAFFWIHSPDSGSEQNYMNGFQCNVTGATSNVALAQSQVPRRCGADPANGKPNASPGNCTYGAKQPLYWFQAEQNNMFEGQYAPPFYNDLYNFVDGPQNDIFADSYPNGIPPPSPNSTVVPSAFLGGSSIPVAASTPASSPFVASSLSASATSFSSVSVSIAASASVSSVPTSASSASSSIIILSSGSGVPSSSAAVAVSTATVISTVVITVTAPASATLPSASSSAINSSESATSSFPASSASAGLSSAFSIATSGSDSTDIITPSFVPASSAFSASAPTSSAASISSSSFTSVSSSTSVSSPSIIILNPTGVTSSAPSSASSIAALSTAPSAASASSTSLPSAGFSPSPLSSEESFPAATTIFLNQPPTASASAQNDSFLEVVAKNGRVFEAAATNSASSSSATGTFCKRDAGRKVFRRRRSLATTAEPQALQPEPESMVSSFHIRRKLHDRRQLWNLF